MIKPIPFKWHDGRRTFGTVAELGVGNYILKRLLNHRTMRSADVTQGYLHFSADELMELDYIGGKQMGLDKRLYLRWVVSVMKISENYYFHCYKILRYLINEIYTSRQGHGNEKI
jgi:hypothetical protein